MHWHEYALRFGLGGLATTRTGLIAEVSGRRRSGLDLAFPAASRQRDPDRETRAHRKQKAGSPGTRRGRQAAALDALGAAIGSFGDWGFAAVMWTLPGRIAPSPASIAAALVRMLVSSACGGPAVGPHRQTEAIRVFMVLCGPVPTVGVCGTLRSVEELAS